MRHQADDVPLVVADAGDVGEGAVRVGLRGRATGRVAVPEHDPLVVLETVDDVRFRVVVSLAVSDRNAKDLAGEGARRERRIALLHADAHVLAMELEVAVPQHRAWEESRLQEDLEPVADPEDGAPMPREVRNSRHDRREAGDGAGPQIVTVREPAWQDHDVRAFEARLLVPDELRLLPEHVPGRVIGVVIAVGSGEDDNGKFHSSFQLPAASFQLPASSSCETWLDATKTTKNPREARHLKAGSGKLEAGSFIPLLSDNFR